MTDKELFIKTVGSEMPTFERVLKAIPTDHQDYRPDPKSKTALELTGSMVASIQLYPKILTEGAVNMDTDFHPATGTPEELAKMMNDAWQGAKTAAEQTNEESWNSEAVMSMSGTPGWKDTRGAMAWGFLLDAVHHRGQLSTYLRAMGGKVPSIYGPSADNAM